jgi:predicted GIY-YIG superfamily endonuclease
LGWRCRDSTVIARSDSSEAIQKLQKILEDAVRWQRVWGNTVDMKQPCVYIMANKRNGTLYTGVTSNLPKRVFEHRESLVRGFSAKYDCKILVWYEVHETMIEAITREKQIKAGSRKKKLALIESFNPDWKDLFETLA